MKRGYVLFAAIISLFFLISCSPPSCIPEKCINNSKVFCEGNKIFNLTYACINDECKVLENSSFACNSLDKESCFNKTALSIIKYSCKDRSCISKTEILDCDKNHICSQGKCTSTCGNGIIDESEDCSNCPYDVKCSEGEKCMNGICVSEDFKQKLCTDDEECDDENPCTYDTCDKQRGKCLNQFLVNKVPSFCCAFDNECDDSKPCTIDSCTDHMCSHENDPSCCSRNEDCDDDNVCTVDSCKENKCMSEYKIALAKGICCDSDDDCDDGNICTLDSCSGKGLTKKCKSEKIEGCCNLAEDCDDSDPCTLDSCVNNKCTYKAFVSNETYDHNGFCSADESATDYEHCVLDFYSEFFKLDDVRAWCDVDDCLSDETCISECSIVSPDSKTEYVCKSGKWVKK